MEDPNNPPVCVGIKFSDIPVAIRPEEEGTYVLEVIIKYKTPKAIKQRSICYVPGTNGDVFDFDKHLLFFAHRATA